MAIDVKLTKLGVLSGPPLVFCALMFAASVVAAPARDVTGVSQNGAGASANSFHGRLPYDVYARERLTSQLTPALYVANSGDVSGSTAIYGFSDGQADPVERIDAFGPLVTDRVGNLYVGEGTQVAVYQPGETTPYKTVVFAPAPPQYTNDGKLALDRYGNFWYTTVCGGYPCDQRGYVSEYNGDGVFQRSLSCRSEYYIYDVVVDAREDVFALYTAQGYGSHGVIEWKREASGWDRCRRLLESQNIIPGIQLTNGGDLVAGAINPFRAETFAKPDFKDIVASDAFVTGKDWGPLTQIALGRGDKEVWALFEMYALHHTKVARYSFRAKGKPSLVLSNTVLTNPIYIATAPCPGRCADGESRSAPSH